MHWTWLHCNSAGPARLPVVITDTTLSSVALVASSESEQAKLVAAGPSKVLIWRVGQDLFVCSVDSYQTNWWMNRRMSRYKVSLSLMWVHNTFYNSCFRFTSRPSLTLQITIIMLVLLTQVSSALQVKGAPFNLKFIFINCCFIFWRFYKFSIFRKPAMREGAAWDMALYR